MTEYTRNISRITVSAVPLPQWRAAMTNADTLYNVTSNLPIDADATVQWPHGHTTLTAPTSMGARNNNVAGNVVAGFSSTTLLEDVGGAFGTLVIAVGGHTVNATTMPQVNISADSPTWGWYQQPYYEVADGVNGAEYYFNEIESALPTTFKFSTPAEDDGSEWNGTFPYTIGKDSGGGGWMYQRKLVTGTLGNNYPSFGGRVFHPFFVPASMTGTGAGAFCIYTLWSGPFAQTNYPNGSSYPAWEPGSLWPSGRPKMRLFHKNTATGAWSIGPVVPDYTFGLNEHRTAVCSVTKRVYVQVYGGPTFFYIDFANGIANATFSGEKIPFNGGYVPGGPGHYNHETHSYTSGCFTNNHPTGLKLWINYGAVNSDTTYRNCLIVTNVETERVVRIFLYPASGEDIPSGNIPATERAAIYYDSANNRVILTSFTNSSPYYWSVGLPPDPMQDAGWTVVRRPIFDGPNGATWARPSTTNGYGKARWHDELGVVFVQGRSEKLMAFRPAP